MNSIIIYLSAHVINWEYTNTSLVKWLSQLLDNPFNAVTLTITYVLVN